jgi:hypothetical protein
MEIADLHGVLSCRYLSFAVAFDTERLASHPSNSKNARRQLRAAN